MTTQDLDALLTAQLPTIYRVAYAACPSQADELFSESVYLFLKWGRVKPDKYAALISSPARTVGTFRQLTNAALSVMWRVEKSAESLDALESETGISEIEWGETTRGSAMAQQRGKRVHGSHIATDEETETLIANLAKASWGELDRLDVADVVRESAVLRLWLSGYSETEIRKPATVRRHVQALQNQI